VTTEVQTEVVHASELQDRVVERIAEIRNPDLFKSYTSELRRYKRRKGKREEIIKEEGLSLLKTTKRGFTKRVYDNAQIFVPRPERPSLNAYAYSPYSREFGSTWHAKVGGLLADPRYNRDIRPQRVEEYAATMGRGEWRDLLSDPIAITAEGDVLNGQHRIAAATRVDWEGEKGPAFLVVWNADPREAQYADGSRRTQKDEKTIATKLLSDGG
jgi:hypothetical protein